jgi:sulfur carrier protein
MKLTLNGLPVDSLSDHLIDLLRDRGIDVERAGIAVAVNGNVVPRRLWAEHRLDDDDEIEVITAMQGG